MKLLWTRPKTKSSEYEKLSDLVEIVLNVVFLDHYVTNSLDLCKRVKLDRQAGRF